MALLLFQGWRVCRHISDNDVVQRPYIRVRPFSFSGLEIFLSEVILMTENKFEVNSTRTQQEEPVALIRVDRMYESLRYNDYSAQNGLGEIVDNSVEAKAAHIDVMVTVGKARKTGKKKATDKITEIAVVDDGCGMNKGTLYLKSTFEYRGKFPIFFCFFCRIAQSSSTLTGTFR